MISFPDVWSCYKTECLHKMAYLILGNDETLLMIKNIIIFGHCQVAESSYILHMNFYQWIVAAQDTFQWLLL